MAEGSTRRGPVAKHGARGKVNLREREREGGGMWGERGGEMWEGSEMWGERGGEMWEGSEMWGERGW